jgi:23S rRNA (uracil1939-C5)-methyltransferase
VNGPAVDLDIVKLVAGGEGLGFVDGKALFVPGVVPGERVRVRVTQRRKDFDRGALLAVLTGSDRRQEPGCGLAGVCGGCDWLHMRYEEQLAQKAAIARETLRRTGKIERPELAIEPSAPFSYRNRIQVHRSEGGALGYMAAGSDSVVPVERCPIAVDGLQGIFAGAAPAPAGLDRFTAFSDTGWVALEGIDDDRDLMVTVGGRPIRFSVGCFFQSNLAMLDRVVPYALDGLSGDAAADLYSGVGLFGAFLARKFKRVVAVETSTLALSFARRNIEGEGHEFHPMPVEQWIASGAAQGPFDAVVVDPPRTGLGPEVRDWLRTAAPRRLSYVSCNPVTLARDLAALVAGGFALDELRLFDLFPQTSHLEAVARLSWRLPG